MRSGCYSVEKARLLQWFRKAAELGLDVAQQNLGILYAKTGTASRISSKPINGSTSRRPRATRMR